MPLFERSGEFLTQVPSTNFALEKDLQSLIEQNLETVFSSRFVASEFQTGAVHGGRIDTLALSEDNNPVIIEYKKVASSELINQSPYYLAWLNDHRGDFEMAVQKALGTTVEVDWGDVRVTCLAPQYKKFDLHAVQMMGANIELWQYKLYENGSLYLDQVFNPTGGTVAPQGTGGKNPVMVEARKKAAITRANASYTMEEHLKDRPPLTLSIANSIRDFILDMDESVSEVPKKFYIAYKVSKNFVCMEIRKNKVLLFLKLDPDDVSPMSSNCRDVREIGHYGTGDLEVTVSAETELQAAQDLVRRAFENVGGA